MVLDFWRDLWRVVDGALGLDGRVLLAARDDPRASAAALVLAVVAGASLTLGQSVVLFANRIPRGRFLVALLAGALLYVARIVLWACSIWIVGLISPRHALPLDATLLAVCFGQAPQLFAFFEMLPYVGTSLRRVLDAYSLIVVVAGLRVMLDVPVRAALLAAGLGWLLQAFLSGLLERPLSGMRSWMWRVVSGRKEFSTAAQVVDELLAARPGAIDPDRVRCSA